MRRLQRRAFAWVIVAAGNGLVVAVAVVEHIPWLAGVSIGVSTAVAVNVYIDTRRYRAREPRDVIHCPRCGKRLRSPQATLDHMVGAHGAVVQTHPIDCDDPTHDHYGMHVAEIRMPLTNEPKPAPVEWTEDQL